MLTLVGASLTAALLAPRVALGETNELPELTSIVCNAPGDCAAVGSYQPSLRVTLGVAFSDHDGVWSYGLPTPLPSGASRFPNVDLTAVGCGAPGSCSAVGSFSESDGATDGLLASESHYWWHTGQATRLPPGASATPLVHVNAVSCASAGSCVAVGDYRNSSGRPQAVIWQESAGVWGPGIRAPLPPTANAGHSSSLVSVACPQRGACAAVGWYGHTASGGGVSVEGLMLTQDGTTWNAAAAALPSGAAGDPETALNSVSCAYAETCTAVGDYTAGDGQQLGLTLQLIGGSWAPGVTPVLPTGASSTSQYTTLESVSCNAADVCAAGGSYYDSSGSYEALVALGTRGRLNVDTEVTLPAGARVRQQAQITSVSCFGAGACIAAGNYIANKGRRGGLLVQETNGSWTPGTTPALPANAAARGTQAGPIACTPDGDCAIAATYTDKHGDPQLGLLRESPGDPARHPTALHVSPLSAAAAQTSLKPLQAPGRGPGARGSLLAAGGARFRYTTVVPTKLAIVWTSIVKRKTVVVARFAGTWEGAGTHSFLVALTAPGRSLLKRSRRLTITTHLKLTAEGARTSGGTATFTAL